MEASNRVVEEDKDIIAEYTELLQQLKHIKTIIDKTDKAGLPLKAYSLGPMPAMVGDFIGCKVPLNTEHIDVLKDIIYRTTETSADYLENIAVIVGVFEGTTEIKTYVIYDAIYTSDSCSEYKRVSVFDDFNWFIEEMERKITELAEIKNQIIKA